MITIRVEQLNVLEYPSATQTDSVMSTAKAIYDEWSNTLNSKPSSTTDEVFRKTCDLLNDGLVEIEFTRAAAGRFVAAVDAWAVNPRRAD
jgi:hypothetical protein